MGSLAWDSSQKTKEKFLPERSFEMPMHWRGGVLALAVLAQMCVSCPAARGQRLPDTVPSQFYFRAIERMYRGDYRDAERTFGRELRGSIKIGVTDRWIDAIAYHAMLGEVYYQQGRLAAALEQFDEACSMYLQYPTWPIRINFRREPVADPNRLRRQPLWGKSGRQFTLGRFQSQELISFGSADSVNRAVQQGGALRSPQLWQVNAIEIVRATALAIRRRNELLGPLGPHDQISKNLAAALARSTTKPNHWSKAWSDLLYGLAQIGVGKPELAKKPLSRSLLVRGQFDHPLTCVAMLELGRLSMDEGDLAGAANLFAEASYSAFYFEDLGIIDEAFRQWSKCQLASASKSVSPALQPAAQWARQRNHDQIFVRTSFALAEQLMQQGDDNSALTTWRAGQARLEDAATGLLGSQSQYLEARLQYRQGRETAEAAIQQAVAQHIGISHHNLQLLLANLRYDKQQLRPRSAVEVYQKLLADPEPKRWVFEPFETLAALKTPHEQAFERWFEAANTRKNLAVALEVADLAKRNRYHSALAWGGRRAALRDLLQSTEKKLTNSARNQRNELLLRYPLYDQALKQGKQLENDLREAWLPGMDEDEQRALVRQWRAWSKNLDEREAMLGELGLQRVPADMQFPPTFATAALQSQLLPGQAVVAFHQVTGSMHGFLVTSGGSTSWKVKSVGRLGSLLSDFLRELGNYDASREMTVEQLTSNAWQEPGAKLYAALFAGSSLDLEAVEELIVVPDGVAWYVPFAALPVQTEDRVQPLVSLTEVRLVPTVGLAVGGTEPWRRVQRTGVVGIDLMPGENDDEQEAKLLSLEKAMENPLQLPTPVPVPSPIVASLLDTLVVLDDVNLEPAKPFGWTPLPLGRSSRKGTLSHWLQLPQFGPQRIILPAAHTIAERGGKTSRRKKSGATPGSELFIASCGLMSTGAQTVLLSNWRVGGESTHELMQEFLQELPYTSATKAWQRSVQLAMELPLRAELEPRVKESKDDPEFTAAHPFFWAGYHLLDRGAPNGENEEPKVKNPPVGKP